MPERIRSRRDGLGPDGGDGHHDRRCGPTLSPHACGVASCAVPWRAVVEEADGSMASLRERRTRGEGDTSVMSEPDMMVERITAILQEDERVRAAWLCGSRARGTSDEFSDIDIWLVVRPTDEAQFIDDWPSMSDKISPTVLRQQVGKRPAFNHITPEWLRFDVSIGTPDDAPKRSRSAVRLLFDLDGLDATLGHSQGPLQPDAAKVRILTTEFLRVLGLLPVVAGRSEYVVGASGVGLLRELLIQLMLEDVGVEDRGGALHLNGLIPEARLQALRDLPPIAATREAVIAGHLACTQLFLPIARELSARTGVQWPAELERAVREHLCRSLSLEFA